MQRISVFSSLIFVACASSAPYQAPSATPGIAADKPAPKPIVSLAEATRERRVVDEAKMKANVEPKAVKIIRDVLSSNPYDARYGIPSVARFQRPASPTMGPVSGPP